VTGLDVVAYDWRMNLLESGRIIRLGVLAAVLGCLPLVSPSSAAAEWFAEGYAGVSSTMDADLKVREGGITQRFKDLEFERSLTYGGRFGTFLNSFPWLGFSLDAINYNSNLDKQTAILKSTGVRAQLAPMDISVTAVSLDLMLRAPLFSTPELPGGRVTPYVLAGPGLFFARAEDHGNFIRRHQDDLDVSLGYHVGGGVGWQFSKTLGLFGEYRYSHVNPEFEFRNFANRATVETDLNTHHFLVGVSVKF
jgi:opacity protein-like surface antigen